MAKLLIVACFMSVTINNGLAQVRDTSLVDETIKAPPTDYLWLMGSLSGSLYFNRLDTAYIQDFGVWGYSVKFGATWA